MGKPTGFKEFTRELPTKIAEFGKIFLCKKYILGTKKP
jgi:hypothetical protein